MHYYGNAKTAACKIKQVFEKSCASIRSPALDRAPDTLDLLLPLTWYFFLFYFFILMFLQGWQHQLTKAAFQLCPDHIIHKMLFRFNSWVAEAMGVKFLAQGNNSSRRPWPSIKPETLRLPGRCPGSVLLPPCWVQGVPLTPLLSFSLLLF